MQDLCTPVLLEHSFMPALSVCRRALRIRMKTPFLRVLQHAAVRTGSDTRLRTEPKITASRSVQLPAWHSGSSSPCDGREVTSR